MKNIYMTLFLACIILIPNNVLSDDKQEFRYFTCHIKRSKIDSKYDEIICVNTNTYINYENNSSFILGCHEGKIIPSFQLKDYKLKDGFINIQYRVDDNKVRSSKWLVNNGNLFNFESKEWLKSLKNGKNLIIRVKTENGSYEEIEFDIGRIDEALKLVSDSCISIK